jgi:hypothetical protein
LGDQHSLRAFDFGKAARHAGAAAAFILSQDIRERVVAAGIQHQQSNTIGIAECLDDVVELDQFERRERAAIHLQIDRHQKVLTVDLQPVSRIVHQARVRAPQALGEAAERGLHRRSVEIAAVNNGKAQPLELFGYIVGIISAVAKFGHRPVAAIADHEGDALFGCARLGEKADGEHEAKDEASER